MLGTSTRFSKGMINLRLKPPSRESRVGREGRKPTGTGPRCHRSTPGLGSPLPASAPGLGAPRVWRQRALASRSLTLLARRVRKCDELLEQRRRLLEITCGQRRQRRRAAGQSSAVPAHAHGLPTHAAGKWMEPPRETAPRGTCACAHGRRRATLLERAINRQVAELEPQRSLGVVRSHWPRGAPRGDISSRRDRRL